MRALLSLLLLISAVAATAAELRAPAQVAAGTAFTIASSGSGEATFYLIGPAQVIKRKVQLGGDIKVQGEEVQHAGRYTAIVCASDCSSSHFYVHPVEASRLSFLVHPSRVPVSQPNAISAVAFVFDTYYNLVTEPSSVLFKVVPKDGHEISATRPSERGIAWVRLTSARQEGPTKIGASVGKISEIRVVQQVASEACNLRIKSNWAGKRLQVETDPVKDCSGNNVSDGTVVSFTAVDLKGKTTVDAPVKRGVAKVEIPVNGNARVTAASGVVTGNELSVGGGQ